MDDLDFQSQATFLKINIIFKTNYHSYIIYFIFFSLSTSSMLNSMLKSNP